MKKTNKTYLLIPIVIVTIIIVVIIYVLNISTGNKLDYLVIPQGDGNDQVDIGLIGIASVNIPESPKVFAYRNGLFGVYNPKRSTVYIYNIYGDIVTEYEVEKTSQNYIVSGVDYVEGLDSIVYVEYNMQTMYKVFAEDYLPKEEEINNLRKYILITKEGNHTELSASLDVQSRPFLRQMDLRVIEGSYIENYPKLYEITDSEVRSSDKNININLITKSSDQNTVDFTNTEDITVSVLRTDSSNRCKPIKLLEDGTLCIENETSAVTGVFSNENLWVSDYWKVNLFGEESELRANVVDVDIEGDIVYILRYSEEKREWIVEWVEV